MLRIMQKQQKLMYNSTDIPTLDPSNNNFAAADEVGESVADQDEPVASTTVDENVSRSDVNNNNNKAKRTVWPEDSNDGWWLFRVYERWTYSYLSPLLAKGSGQHHSGIRLSEEDLLVLPESMKSEHLSIHFRELFYRGKGNQSLLKTLWYLIRAIYVPAGFCQLVTVLCQSTNPLMVRELLRILEEHPSQKVVGEGVPFAIGIFLVLFLNGLANHRHRHLAMKSGVLMRNALVNAIYEHVLHLTSKGKMGLTSGSVSTLVAVDTQKVFEAAQEGHLLWALPLSVTIVTLLLVMVMGPITLVGIAVLVSFLPVASFVTAKMLSIRQKRVKKTEERVGLVNAMLQGIKVAKLNNYEEQYQQKISSARKQELALLRAEMAVWGATLTITVISPLLAAASTFALYVLVDENNILTASKTFSVLLLFAALRFPINYAARFLGKAAQAASAIQRISKFLHREAQYEDSNTGPTENRDSDPDRPGPVLRLHQASFRQGFDEENDSPDAANESAPSPPATFTVSTFDVSVRKGEVLAVCGPVGSGKSTLINGVVAEVLPASETTKVELNGRVAIVPQTPFILNTTFRENILFGLPYERAKYERVLDCCCLRPDIEQLGASQDLTQIGERGVTLSGGQKQRVSLARAAYADPDVVLLDDPLSALDAGTSRLVFDKLIKGQGAYFEDSAVILVTHASHFLNIVDRILIIVGGRNEFLGTWNDLAAFEPENETTRKAVDHIKSSVQEGAESSEDKGSQVDSDDSLDTNAKKMHRIMLTEEREFGFSSVKTWLLWFRYAGGAYFFSLTVLFLGLDRFLYVAVEVWIARWTSGAEEQIHFLGKTFDPQTDGRSAQYDYLRVFASLCLASVIATSCRSEWVVIGGTRAATKVAADMLESVLRAPMSYFETTPMGRILNRFTYDLEVIDVVLTEAMSILMTASGWFVAGVLVMSTILPYMVLALFPVVIIYMIVLLQYRKSGVDLQRLDAVSRSPVQAMVTEVLDGSSLIRVFEQQRVFVQRFRKASDTNSSALLNFVTAQRWLGVRIESLGATVVLVSSTLVVCLNDVLRIEPGLVGLLVIWSANFTITLGFLIDFFGEAEAAITAIERVDAMTHIPSEKAMKSEHNLMPPPEWPTSGELSFENVCLRYRPGLPLALDNLTFNVPAGKSCGVVGRTGAGKSSLTVALFRLVEIESGKVILDGRELGQLGLSDVRGRPNGIGIIPQDPFLTGSNIRSVLDPFKQHSDADVLEALCAVRMAGVSDLTSKLDSLVEEGGSNFSVGERQLLNLARALLSKPKVLVLDEATASVDGETDAFIQQMLRTRFTGTTLLTIAHRLQTIMDYDLILVMANGRAAEFGSPLGLLASGGLFSDLVDATGPESAKALRQLAAKKAP